MKQTRNLKGFCLKRICGALTRLETASQRLRLNLEEGTTWCTKEELRILQRNEALRERHRGKPCFVIGNGPSVSKQDLGPLGGWTTFAMSGFWKHPIVRQWQPSYYCFADPLFFDGSEAMGRFFSEMRKCITSTSYIMPLTGRTAIEQQALVKDSPVYYASFQGSLNRTFAQQVNFCHPVPGVRSVAQLAILSAIYMGCSPIYLIGLDHDWLAQRGNDRHFYLGKTVQGHPIAHGNLDRFTYKHDLVDVLRLWEGYERLQVIASTNGCEIYNASDGGFLDVFPRRSFETIVASA